jgi:hypothetical protein
MSQVNGSNWGGNVPVSSGSGTASSAAVTVSKDLCVITSEALTTAADATDIITVTNTKIVAGTTVRANLIDYSGTFSTNGIPVVNIDAINTGAGTCVINISNAHAANALSGVVKVLLEVITLPV